MAERTCAEIECAERPTRRGLCAHHYMYRWHRGLIETTPYQPAEQRFWQRVVKTETCWLWTGKPTIWGYGRLKDRGRFVSAHRYSYELLVGPIPDGLTIDHLCHNAAKDVCVGGPTCPHRMCVNPAHLEAVPIGVNTGRGTTWDYNRNKTHCAKGHPYSGDNVRVNAKGHRKCRTCERDRAREVRARKAA